MGLTTGSISANFSALTAPRERDRSELFTGLNGDRRLQNDPAGSRTQPPRIGLTPNATEELRAGFGENTLSPAGAALRTLDRTVRTVRESLPTLADRREDLRTRLTELRELNSGRDDENEAPPRAAAPEEAREPLRVNTLDLDTPRARAVSQSRDFITALNDRAGRALSQLNGERPRSVAGTSIQIGDRIFPVEDAQPPSVLDVRA